MKSWERNGFLGRCMETRIFEVPGVEFLRIGSATFSTLLYFNRDCYP